MTLKNLNKRRFTDSGVTFVEVAFSLAIFLSLFIFSFWCSVRINAKGALDYSLRTGMRLAFTRGDIRGGDFGAPGGLQTYLSSGGKWRPVTEQPYKLMVDWSGTAGDPVKILTLDRTSKYWDGCPTIAPTLPDILRRGSVTEAAANTYYEDVSLAVFQANNAAGCTGKLKLYMMPPVYSLSLAYIYETLLETVGPGISYPCNPDLPAASGGTPGCVGCRFLNPDSLRSDVKSDGGGNPIAPDADYTDLSPSSAQEEVKWYPRVPNRRILIECSYKPAIGFVRPVANAIVNQLSPTLRSRFFYLGSNDN